MTNTVLFKKLIKTHITLILLSGPGPVVRIKILLIFLKDSLLRK